MRGIVEASLVIALRRLYWLCLAMLIFVLCSGHSQAAFAATSTDTLISPTPAQGGLSLVLDAGLDGSARIGYWVPVRVTVSNGSSAPFSGTVLARVFSGFRRVATATDTVLSSEQFEEFVTVARGMQKQVTLYVPFDVIGPINYRGVQVDLLDSHRRVVATQDQRVYTLNAGDVLVGTLSDASTNFDALNRAALPSAASSLLLSSFDATTLPTMATVLDNLDALVLVDFTTSTLKPAQLSALATWINRGGVLIEVGGLAWQRTLGGLPSDLLPIAVQNTSTLPAGTPLLPPDQQTATRDSILISAATLAQQGGSGGGSGLAGESVLASGTTPLVVQVRRGQGVICYLAFDPTQPPLLNQSSTSTLWGQILLRTLGDRLLLSSAAPHYPGGPGAILARGGILPILQPGISFAILLLALLFITYALVLGPVRVWLVWRFKRPLWSWRIILSTIVVFSLLAYGIAFYQHSASLIDNSISIIQLSEDGSPLASMGHITTYMGIFVPNAGDFRVRIPGTPQLQLAQPVADLQLLTNAPVASDDSASTVVYGPNETSVNLQSLGLWTFHGLVSEQDRQLHGSVLTHLELRSNMLVGSVTNALDTPLNDVYVLLPHSFVTIGHLAAGATQQIDLPLQSGSPPATSKRASAQTNSPLLADLIATNSGLPVSYYPYASGGQPQTEFQRHMALLSALSGAGFTYIPCGGPCITHGTLDKSTIVSTPPALPTLHLANGSDPLLLSGASATLIGWTEQPLDGIDSVTINNTHPHGFHDNMIQMPLNIGLSTPLNIPDVLTGQIIAVQGYDLASVLPNIYTLSTGSLTFEFALSSGPRSHSRGFTITVPDAPSTGQNTGINYFQVHLYNWYTASWDTIMLNHYTFSTANTRAYIGPDGRVLLQLANQDTTVGMLFLGKPSLSLQ